MTTADVTAVNLAPQLPPGPTTHPVLQLLQYSFKPLAYLEECARHGDGDTFTFRLAGFGTLVMLSKPDDIRDVFRADPAVLHAGEGNRLLAELVGDTSVLVLDENLHARQRRVLMPPLKGERMRTFFDAMQQETLSVCREWTARGAVQADVDMQRITLRVILRAVLGMEGGPVFDTLEASMGRMLRESRHPLVLVMYNLFPPHRFRGAQWLPFYRLRRRFDDELYRHIAAARAQAPEARPACLLSDLLATVYDDGTTMSDEEVRDAVVTILAAGHDTTALSLAWALELIASHPQELARLQAELTEVCGDGPVTPETLPRLERLDAVIRETLRLRNILPYVVRVVKAPITIGAYTYPPGVVLCPAIHLLHRRPDLYPQPETFRPERFLERKFAPHEWDPFGGGNRACLGQAFALYEMRVVLATLLQTLDLARPPGAVSKPARRGISIGPSDGTRLEVRARR